MWTYGHMKMDYINMNMEFSGSSSGDTTAGGSEGEVTADQNPLDALDYGGKTFTISMSATNISSHQLMMGPEESTGDTVDTRPSRPAMFCCLRRTASEASRGSATSPLTWA